MFSLREIKSCFCIITVISVVVSKCLRLLVVFFCTGLLALTSLPTPLSPCCHLLAVWPKCLAAESTQ